MMPFTDTAYLDSPHLNAPYWEKANRHLCAKIFRELTHEGTLTPILMTGTPDQAALFEITTAEHTYTFSGQWFSLEHLDIDEQTIQKTNGGHEQPLDAIQLILELNPILKISKTVLPLYLEEISSTLYGLAFKIRQQTIPAKILSQLPYPIIEANMFEGHPVFIANNARLGFNHQDHHDYTPESGQSTQLVWIAALRQKAHFSALSDLDYDELMQTELGPLQMALFHQRLHQQDCLPDDYYYMPVHPWQWDNKISIGFASAIAQKHIVYLGVSLDHYAPQQSIRTFYNVTNPAKNYVKTALSILNMGFIRGLSSQSMVLTPNVNEWLSNLIEHDAVFADCRFIILRERAAIGYFNDYYEQAVHTHHPHKHMLAALWRESPTPLLSANERVMTMAALLHVDAHNQSLIASLIRAAQTDTETWLSQYLHAYLKPLLHAFFAYDLVFMPHGENLILVLADNQPVSVFMKDIGEEIALLNSDTIVPAELSFLHVTIQEPLKTNYILLDVFDCFFRYLTPILSKELDYSEQSFWQLVASTVSTYQSEHPEFAKKYQKYNLFQEHFSRTCLNTLQFNNNQQMIDLDDREKNLRFTGVLNNPIYPWRPDAL